MQYLLHKVGIQSFLVIGTGAGEAHKWNCVRIDGNYYHVDLTWDDQDSVTYHAYLNVTDAQILEEHTITKPGFALPSCTATAANYFAVKGGMLTKPYSVSTIAKLLKDGKGRAHVFLPGDPEEFGTWYGSNIDAIAQANGLTNGYYYGFEGLGREIVLILTSLNITSQPKDEPAVEGQSITIIFDVEGEGLTFQWYLADTGKEDFVPVGNPDDNWFFIAADDVRVGQRYYCVVTDKYGNSETTDIVTIYKPNHSSSGSCGDGVTWVYEDTVLTISGNGYMDIPERAPWAGFASQITSIVIEDGVKNLDADALVRCTGLTKIAIGKNIAKLYADDLDQCENLEKITISPENPTFSDNNQGVIYDKEKTELLYVPRSYGYSLAIPNGVTTIPDYVLADRNINTLSLPTSIVYFGNQEFHHGGPVQSIVYEGTETQWQKVYVAEGHTTIAGKMIFQGDNVIIIAQPEDVTVEVGEDAVLTVIASGPELSYKWMLVPFDKTAKITLLPETSNTVSIKMTPELSGSQVYCTITNKHGQAKMTRYATLRMTDHDSKAVITTQPKNCEVKNGETATATVVATGEGLTYQWYRKKYSYDFTGELDPTATGPTYSVLITEDFYGCYVYCVITDKYNCSVQSETVQLCRQRPVRIKTQPTDLEVWEGDSFSVTVATEGKVSSYLWYYAQKDSDEFVAKDNSIYCFNGTMNASNNGLRVYCEITDIYGNTVTTNVVTISMRKTGKYCGNDATWKLDANGILTISGTGPMYPLKNHVPWDKNAVKTLIIEDGITSVGEYAADSMLSLTTVVLPSSLTNIDCAAFYWCQSLKNIYYAGSEEQWENISIEHSNDYLTKAKRYYNIVNEPVSITKQPVSEAVVEGRNTNVSVSASGIGLTYQWYYKEKGSSKFSLTTSFTGPTYSVQMTEARNGRQLYCVITDIFGNSVTSDTVTITMIPKAKIAKQPASVKVGNGQKAAVSVQATGDGLSYQWYYKNKGETAFKKSSNTTNTYSATMSTTVNGRQVYCVVTDEYGNSVKSNTVTISLKFSITKQPQSVTVIKNKTAKISVSAEGEGLTYQWYYKTKSGKSFKKLSSAKSSSYSVKMTSSKNGRQMYCVIKDKYGNTLKTNTVTLKVAPKVKITKNVASSVKVNAGKTASVYVKASGDGLKYTWYYKNKGAKSYSKSSVTTATYSTTMSASVNGRKVYCVVTDKYGQTTKSKTSTLYAKTTITKQPTSVNITNGKTAKVTVSAAGEKLSYKWYYKNPGSKSFKRASSVKGSTYSCTMSNSINGRQVYCVVKSKYGGSIKTNVVTLSSSAKCGNSVYWTWDGSGTLTITGSGAMYNYEDGKAPWNSIKSSIKTVKISSGVTTVGARAFKDCTNITSVSLPATLTDIKEWAFKGCEKLTSISIPNGVKAIGAYAFSACVKLKHIVLSDALQSIGEWAFNSCHSITYVYLGGSLTRIYNGAFSQCYALTDLFYGGTEDNWLALKIDMNNLELKHAAKQYVPSRNDLPV